jgi:signal transduction histidine kinase
MKTRGAVQNLPVTFPSPLDYDATIASLAELAVPALGDAAVVYVVEEGGVAIRPVAATCADPAHSKQVQRELRHSELDAEAPDGVAGVVRTGEPELLERRLLVPLAVGGRVLGALAILALDAPAFGPEDLALAVEYARRASNALDAARAVRAAKEEVRVRDELVAVAAHELRAPLSAVHLALDVLERCSRDAAPGASLPQPIAAGIDVARRQLRRMTDMLDLLFDFTRMKPGAAGLTFEEIDLVPIVDALVEQLGEEAAHRGSTIVFHAPAFARACADRLRIEQVVRNLIANAIKYGGGHPIHIRVDVERSWVVIEVADSGFGISADELSRVFRRHERPPPGKSPGGLGLGLYIARDIVDSHGGSVTVDSKIGGGSCFRVRLPIKRSAIYDLPR